MQRHGSNKTTAVAEWELPVHVQTLMRKVWRFTMKNMRTIIAGLTLVVMLSGCAGMSAREQRMLSGGAIGAAGGAAIGAAAGGSPAIGAAVGGAAGVVGGLIVDEWDKNRPARNESKAY
jgi:hypothetical protein